MLIQVFTHKQKKRLKNKEGKFKHGRPTVPYIRTGATLSSAAALLTTGS